jgi:hypothetical protein
VTPALGQNIGLDKHFALLTIVGPGWGPKLCPRIGTVKRPQEILTIICTNFFQELKYKEFTLYNYIL